MGGGTAQEGEGAQVKATAQEGEGAQAKAHLPPTLGGTGEGHSTGGGGGTGEGHSTGGGGGTGEGTSSSYPTPVMAHDCSEFSPFVNRTGEVRLALYYRQLPEAERRLFNRNCTV